ncbi:MAG: hypothetical protein Q8R85_06095 [Bosea sp. (in: a-proteobacteria)]|uniref:hypothetical protein n=1 Tax=Hyphomicrobiales TaxID=356 RepID=UPI0008328351|nr:MULTISPECIES: hypothetical protein [Hyphomicrobiales]MDP3600727.1 hypothetical protein [Bosea sp. (in: a-proteobacteria)]
MTKKLDLKAMRQAAEQEADKALAERPVTIRSNAAAVRVFFPAIVKMREAGKSWEEIAGRIEGWCGRKIAPLTVKQYVTDIRRGRMKPDPGDDDAVVAQPDDRGGPSPSAAGEGQIALRQQVAKSTQAVSREAPAEGAPRNTNSQTGPASAPDLAEAALPELGTFKPKPDKF